MVPAKLAAVALGVAFFVSCGSSEKAGEVAAPTVRGVQFETVRLQDSPALYEATGTIRSATSSIVSAQIAGTVLEMRVQAGDRVKRGQLMAVIDDRSQRAQLAAADAGVAVASQGITEVEQALQAATADRQFAEATYKRYQALLAKNSLSRQEFDGAEARYKAAVANERALEARKQQVAARVQEAQSQQESAKTVFSYSRVTSPIDGVVTVKAVDPGTVVMPGAPLLTVEDTGHYRLEASVPERYLREVVLGTSVSVSSEGKSHQGRVVEIVPAADPASRTSTVKIALPADCGCRSGQYGTAGFPMGAEKRLSVPRQAIAENGGLEGVYVKNQAGRLEYRLVKSGKVFGERVEILSGLAEGDEVAVSEIARLQDGARVEAQ